MALNKFDFLIEAIKNWKQSGTITQSSMQLCKAMVRHIDSQSTKIVVEFGAGDGVITKHILDKLPIDGKLYAFEINDILFEQLSNIKDDRLVAIYDSAERVGYYLERDGLESVDSIISSIPFVVLPTEMTISILQEAKIYIKQGGYFVQFNYSKVLKDLYKSIFNHYTVDYIFLNTPPAFVFTCVKK